MNKYLIETKILNYSAKNIVDLISDRKWKFLDPIDMVREIYNYVRDEIKFGYNSSDDIEASKVLSDGYGQCNTKSTLLMALLRSCGIPNRIHGFTIDKGLQKGAITGIWYELSPQKILHSWVEIYINNNWYILEGVIIDKEYLSKLQKRNEDCITTFCGFGIFTDNFNNPPIEWNLNNTYIQEKGINQDFGIFDSPDIFYSKHNQKLGVIKFLIYKYFVRHRINNVVDKIRKE